MFRSGKFIKGVIIKVLIVCCLLGGTVQAVVLPTNEFYINDYAQVLNQETKEYILNMSVALQERTSVQIVVVTVKNLEGQTMEEYASELFREFKIGDKEKNNGILLICSKEDRECRIQVGHGLEEMLPKRKLENIQDKYIVSYLKNNEYNKGIKNGFYAILREVSDKYGITIHEEKNKMGGKHLECL